MGDLDVILPLWTKEFAVFDNILSTHVLYNML